MKDVADANRCVPHMLQLLNAARGARLRAFYIDNPGDYETWKYVAPIQKAAWSRRTFEYGTWGGEIRREFEPQRIPNYASAVVTTEEVVEAVSRLRPIAFG